MPRPALRSRSLKRAKVRRPGGTLATHYRKRKPSPAKCGSCGGLLSGVPSLRKTGMSRLAKSSRRPERPFGGSLCPACSREAIKGRFLIK